MGEKFKKTWIVGLIPVLVALGFNLNVLNNGLGWDDDRIIPNIRIPERWTLIFLNDPSAVPVGGSRDFYYRPMVSLSYVADHWIWGDDPFGFHLTTLLFHALNAGLVFLLAGSLVFPRGRNFIPHERPPPGSSWIEEEHMVPLLSGSFFAVHPVHAEAVAWIAGRNDVICTTFLLGAFLAFIRFQKEGRWGALAFSAVLFFLALLTKELAIGLVVLFPFLIVLMRGDTGPSRAVLSRVKFHASWVFSPAVLAVYFWLRHFNLSLPLGPAGPPGGSPQGTVLDAFRVLGYYFGLLVFPFPHRPFIGSIPDGFLYILLMAGLFAVVAWGTVYSLKRGELAPGVGLFWTAVFLLPAVAAGILRPAVSPLAERYVYGASAGFLVASGWMVQKGIHSIRKKDFGVRMRLYPMIILVLGVLLVFMGRESWQRNRVWADKGTFWKAAVKSSPGTAFPHEQLGIYLAREKRFPEAEKEFLLALKFSALYRQQISTLNNLGSLYSMEGRYSEALSVLKKTIEMDPENDEVLWHLAEVLFQTAVEKEVSVDGVRSVLAYDETLFSEGERYLKKALALRPMLPLLYEAGRTYERFGRPGEARRYYNKILESGRVSQTSIVQKARNRLDQLPEPSN